MQTGPFRDMVKEQEDPTPANSTGSGGGAAPSSADSARQAAPDHQIEPGDPAELQRLVEERDRALHEKAELFDRFQRAQAEFENARRRMTREVTEAREYAAFAVVEALLPVVDDFERAVEIESADPELQKGLDLIRSRLFDTLTRFGLEPIEAAEFDPNLHQAVDRAPAEDDEEDQRILEVYRKGYMFKDRLLRAAMVKVAVKE